MTEEIILKVKNLNKTFGKKGNKVVALNDVNFDLKKNEILGIIGESGSGKSTIAKIITGLYKADGGEIFLYDEEIGKLKKSQMHKVYKKIQMVFQDAYGSMNPRMKVGSAIKDGYCHFCRENISKREIDDKVEELLKKVGLPSDYIYKYPYELSGGECQRVAIARAIMVMPDILICDEATSALDVSVQAQIVNLLLDLREELNMSMIFITHNLPLVSCFGDNLIIMRSGEIVESGNAKEVLNSPKMDYTKNLLSSVLEV